MRVGGRVRGGSQGEAGEAFPRRWHSGRVLPDLSARALSVAPSLLGCVLRRGEVAVRIVEVEAYEGAEDPASHAYRGRTARNEVMFGPAGHLYVYRLHGSSCCNIVCGRPGTASGVLLRAGEVVAGLAVARANRAARRTTPVPDVALARGPGNLCRALGITGADNGTALSGTGTVTLLGGDPVPAPAAGPRSNVARAADRAWRFWDPASPSVSALRRHPRASA